MGQDGAKMFQDGAKMMVQHVAKVCQDGAMVGQDGDQIASTVARAEVMETSQWGKLCASLTRARTHFHMPTQGRITTYWFCSLPNL